MKIKYILTAPVEVCHYAGMQKYTMKSLAEKVGCTPDTLFKHKGRRANVSARLAMRLEKLTGISHSKWLYPEQYGNPWDYIDLSQGN